MSYFDSIAYIHWFNFN